MKIIIRIETPYGKIIDAEADIYKKFMPHVLKSITILLGAYSTKKITIFTFLKNRHKTSKILQRVKLKKDRL